MKVTRVAGLNERRCIVRDVSGYYGTIVTIAKHWSRKEWTQDAWIEKIIVATTAVVKQHPVLQAVVTGSQTNHPMVNAGEVNVSEHINQLDLNDNVDTAETMLQQALCKIHAESFEHYEKRPQWKLYVTPSSDSRSIYIAFAASHTLTDGMSGIIFHKSLLSKMRGASTEEKTPSDLTLPPSIENAGNLSISFSFLLKPLLNEFLPAFITRLLGIAPPTQLWTGATSRPALPAADQLVETRVVVKLIQPKVLDQLLQACRKRDCRLTSLLNLIVAKSLAEALKKRQLEHRSYMAEVPYDLRRCLTQWNTSMGNYASSIDLLIELNDDVDSKNFSEQEWARVRMDTVKLQKAAGSLADQSVGLLKYVSNIEEWVKRRASQPTNVSFSTSNLGSFSTGHEDDPSYTVQEFVFSQSADATGAPFNLNVASSASGPLAIVMSWLPGMLGTEEAISRDEADFAEEVCQSMMLRLETVAADEDHKQAS